jgi:hypothetical protein
MDSKGLILIGLIVTMTAIAILAAGMLYITTTGTYGELFANRQARAYYLAESGGRYALQRFIADETKIDTLTVYSLSNGDQFAVRSYDTPGDSSRLLIESTGIVGSGWITTRRKITWNVVKMMAALPGQDAPISIGFDEDGDTALDTTWDPGTGTDAAIVSTGPSGGDTALQFKGKEGMINLKWGGNPDAPDLVAAWDNNNQLLGYAMQAKVNVEAEGGKGDYYMMGLSFRLDTKGNLDPDDDDSYGISFFKSVASDKKAPSWITSAAFSTFSSLRDGNVYAVLWEKIDGTYALIDHRRMTVLYGVIDDGALKAWSTILVKVDEAYSGSDGTRENHIYVYVQGTDENPRGRRSWDYNIFNPVLWSDYSVHAVWHANTAYEEGDVVRPSPRNGHCYVCIGSGTSDSSSPSWPVARDAAVTDGTVVWRESNKIIDGTLTSENFDTERPSEIGVHAFYDSPAANDQFFDDFGMVIAKSGDSGSIQY